MPAANNNNSLPLSPGKSLANLTQTERVKPEELPVGTILENKFKLVELVQNHPTLGLTYNAINQQGDGYILKMDAEVNLLSFVRSEAGFLQAVGRQVNKVNATELFVELVHGAKYKTYIYFATRFRPGPTLNECWSSMSNGKFTVSTASRIAYFIFKAFEVVHQLGYLMRRIDPNVIRFDAATRQIYLSDLSSTKLDPRKLKMQIMVKWAGSGLYAPLTHHQGKSHMQQHDLESVVYLLVEMTVGKLPWEDAPSDIMGSTKRAAVTNQILFKECPPQYAAIYTYISLLNDESGKIDYQQIYGKLEEAWKSNGVQDIAAPFDFEAHMLPLDGPSR